MRIGNKLRQRPTAASALFGNRSEKMKLTDLEQNQIDAQVLNSLAVTIVNFGDRQSFAFNYK